jgi:hypothetical protein
MLIFAVFVNIIQLGVDVLRRISFVRLVLFIIINIFIKIIPLYTIWSVPVRAKEDNIFYVGLFVLYIIWLIINKVDILGFVKNYVTTSNRGEGSPFINLILSLKPRK